MKLFITAALLSSTISVSALAAYDDFDCRASASLKNAYLDCVSCGAQKYFSDKFPDKEVVPSEKWLAFLGVMTKQTSHLAPSRPDGRFTSRDNDIVSNFDAREAYQKKVIAQVQAYGFCTKFIGKKNRGKDMSADDWKVVFSYLTTSKNASDAELEKLAEFFGFDNPKFGSKAESNMRYLVTGKRVNPALETNRNRLNDFSEDPKDQRRPNFKRRLSEILDSNYDISGERTDTRAAITTGDKSTGLRECLEEIRGMQEGRGDTMASTAFRNDSSSYEFCSTMANSCDMAPNFCAGRPAPAGVVVPKAPGKTHESAIATGVADRNVTGKNLPPMAPVTTKKTKPSDDSLPAPLQESSQHSMDALPDPKSGNR